MGMVTLNQSLQALVEADRVTPDRTIAMSLKPNELAQALLRRD
jgi:twitching motility protein PilT